MRILLADDHALIRAGIRALLEVLPEVEVVAEADNGRDALEKIQLHKPDVVLMDIAMPGLNGLDALARIRAEFPQVKVVVLTGYANEEYVLKAVRSGAMGYLLKQSAPAELEMALTIVGSGETYLTPAIATRLTEYLRRNGSMDDPSAQLTPRQREILQLIAEGQSTKEIAGTLGISAKTVEMHRAHLMERLQIKEIAGLVRYAIRTGIVGPER